MEGYVVGSIADIISNNYSSNRKSKVEKLKLNNSQSSSVTKCEDIIPSSNVSKSDRKNKNKVLRNEFSALARLPAETEHIDVCENSTKSVNSQVQTKCKPKKRKKLNTREDQEVWKQKRPKTDLFNENSVPSDSESDEVENVGKHSKENKKLSKNHIENKDLNENTVFIGNIPINYDKKKICKAFSKFGEIQNARIRCVPIADINLSKKVAAIKKKFNPKRNSLVAYVNFKSLDSAKAAVNANGMIIDGHHLRVDFADSNKERDNNKAVFVGGLPFDIEDDELWEVFQNCGKINSVRIIRDSQTSMGKGFGYVNFDSTTSVELALQLNGQELKKRVINVKRCVNAKNKNKLNGFGKKKSKEMANELLCKRGKKFKEEKKKLKKENKNFSSDFEGRKASQKQKKKKKLSKAALRQRKLVKILATS